MSKRNSAWPDLPYQDWKDTYATMHMWSQIVGKIRMESSPWMNHSWHVTLYVTSKGLTTSLIPGRDKPFQIDFDFIGHRLVIQTAEGEERAFALEPGPVSGFYEKVFSRMADLGIDVKIDKMPNEVEKPIPFDEDEEHRSYDPEYAGRFWRALVEISRVFSEFRGNFIGKCSPVHFFWGAFDLAVSRFSGRGAPEHPGGIPNLPDRIVKEAYSQEVCSCGFWPGGDYLPYPVFYSYAYPEPAGFSEAKVKPDEAIYSDDMKEFILPYDAVRKSDSPGSKLMEFLETTYEAAANLGKWDRKALERGLTETRLLFC
jgi:hypothetical protein